MDFLRGQTILYGLSKTMLRRLPAPQVEYVMVFRDCNDEDGCGAPGLLDDGFGPE
jgi:hypothetical protein